MATKLKLLNKVEERVSTEQTAGLEGGIEKEGVENLKTLLKRWRFFITLGHMQLCN